MMTQTKIMSKLIRLNATVIEMRERIPPQFNGGATVAYLYGDKFTELSYVIAVSKLEASIETLNEVLERKSLIK